MRISRAGLLVWASLATWACDKPQDGAPPAAVTADAASAPSAARQLADAGLAAAPPSPGAPAAAGGASAWRGSYKSKAGELYIPADWKGVRFNVPEVSAGIGEGAIALHVDGPSRRVTGTIEGPLGPATLDGVASDGKITAIIRRADPADRGFTGTLAGKIDGDHATGEMNVSLPEASAIRAATFSASPDRAAP